MFADYACFNTTVVNSPNKRIFKVTIFNDKMVTDLIFEVPNIMGKEFTIRLLENEYWWGGIVDDGIFMPYGYIEHSRDMTNFNGNQCSPLLISNKGRYVWSQERFTYTFKGRELQIKSDFGDVEFGSGYRNLREVYRFVSKKYFPPSGTIPDKLLFTAPQYNLWIELLYEPTQQKVLEYAQAVIENDMPPGVLMIDDNWQQYYGSWEFHPGRFPNPEEMVEKLNEMGFKVMLWVCPMISPDTATFRMLRDKGYLIKDKNGEIAIRKWWNGYSSLIDCTNPNAVQWFQSQMDNLIDRYGIDGFKLDAGDPEFYEDSDICAVPTTKNGHCEAWAKVGLKYALNEYRACWKMAGFPLVQRLKDKNHSWEGNGLASLIPNGLAQGLMGYAFNCPDMIGGGEYLNFLANAAQLDQELFVRYAQCAALFPMMQFSAAPWRVLDKQHLSYCVEAAKLHVNMGDTIVKLAEHAAKTGEPIMRHMAYVFPDGGYEKIADQFMLGDNILVAPVLKKGAVTRKVVFPEGTWLGDDGSEITGPRTVEVEVPLSRLPWYRKVKY